MKPTMQTESNKLTKLILATNKAIKRAQGVKNLACEAKLTLARNLLVEARASTPSHKAEQCVARLFAAELRHKQRTGRLAGWAELEGLTYVGFIDDLATSLPHLSTLSTELYDVAKNVISKIDNCGQV